MQTIRRNALSLIVLFVIGAWGISQLESLPVLMPIYVDKSIVFILSKLGFVLSVPLTLIFAFVFLWPLRLKKNSKENIRVREEDREHAFIVTILAVMYYILTIYGVKNGDPSFVQFMSPILMALFFISMGRYIIAVKEYSSHALRPILIKRDEAYKPWAQFCGQGLIGFSTLSLVIYLAGFSEWSINILLLGTMVLPILSIPYFGLKYRSARSPHH